MCVIFTVTIDETSTAALRSCLSLHRAGRLLLAVCAPTKVQSEKQKENRYVLQYDNSHSQNCIFSMTQAWITQ